MFIKVTGLIVLLIVVSIPLFLHLDVLPFRIWDESRLAANAYEMHKNGNLIVTHYEGQPEMWSTKPPLMIWLQVIFIKLLGFSELAIRLPSAIAGLLTCVVLMIFSYQYFKNLLIGAFACLVLITINGYIEAHAVRTGDYDGLLALFTTIFTLAAFLYAEKGRDKWMVICIAGITFAVLTKSIQPLLFLPGIATWFLLKHKLNLLLKKSLVVEGLIAISIVAAYYIIRETMNAGYLQAVWENELGGRYLKPLEDNAEGPFYYFRWMKHMLAYWLWLIPVAIIAGWLSKNEQVKKLTIYTFITCATYLLIITFSKTKLYWYAVPMFPLISLNVALLLYQAFEYVKQFKVFRKMQVIAFLIICIVFIYPYLQIGRKVYHPEEYSWDKMYPISEILQDALHGKISMHNKVISYTDFDQHLKVYSAALKDMGQNIQHKAPDNLSKGDTVIASETGVYAIIESKYSYDLLKDEDDVRIYLIK